MPVDASEIYRRYVGAVVLHGHASAAALGLGGTDLYALNSLDIGGPMTSGELADATGLTTGATTRLIDRLERAGHVRRTPDAADRRRVYVELIERPAGVDDTVDPARHKIEAILRDYDDQQLASLFDYFRRAATAYADATADLRRVSRG
jgi:DNA-binding MarR family transcriptional regulator